MKKYLGIFTLTLFAVGLMCGSVFAAASLNAGNTTVASELVPAAGLAIPAVNTGYQPNGAVATSSQINVSLTNGTFTAATNLTICDSLLGGAASTYGTVAVPVAPNNTSVTIVTTKPMASGTVYHFEPTAVCAGAVTPLNNVNIAAGSVGGAIVTMTTDNNLNPGDTNLFATANVTTLVDQFSVELTPVTSVITFLSGMKQLSTAGAVSLNSEFNFNILSNETLGTKIATGLANNISCGAMGAGAGKAFKYTATPGTGGNFSGIAAATGFGYLIANAGYTVIDNAITATKAAATGDVETATFRVCGSATSATTKALAANQNQLRLTVDGTTVLTPRVYDIGISTVTGAIILAGPRVVIPLTTLGWTWTIDSSQYYLPLIGSNAAAGRETYIKLQSKNTSSAANGYSVAILAADGSTTATLTGTIIPGTPTSITGAQLIAAATAAGKTIDGQAGFAAIITVNAPETDVFAYANMLDASGAKRIPVKTVNGAISE
jgi:hypothetical protein